MNEMYRVVQNMRKLGISDAEIRRTLKKNKVAEVTALMQGRFVPFKPSKEIRKRVRQNGNNLPMSEIFRIRNEFRSRKLGAQPEPEAQVEEPRTPDLAPSAPQTQQPVAAAVPPPAAAQAGAVPAQVAAPAPTSQPQGSGGIIGLLSSGNPIDALKNLQIFERNQ
jgi:hypothetical protein